MAAPIDIPWTTLAQTLGGGGLGGFFTWLVARRRARADDQTAQAAMVKAAQEAATQLISSLQADIKGLRDDAVEDRARIEALEASLAREKRARTDERHALAEAATLEQARARRAETRAIRAEQELEVAAGERRQLLQIIDSLTRRLRELGIDVPLPAPRATEPILLGAPADA